MRHEPRTIHLRLGLMVGLLAIGAALAACGQAQPTLEQSSNAASGTSGAAALSIPQGELTRPAQLALGTLKLEGTALAVSQEQSAQLAFLWQAYGSLTRGDTAASEELEALVNQIEGAMSAEQLRAIRGMELSRETMMDWVQESGVAAAAEGSAEGEQGFFGFGPPPGMEGGAPGRGGGDGGGPPAGGPRGEGGLMMSPGAGAGAGAMSGSGGLSPEMQATLQAQRSPAGAGDRIVLMLLEPLVDLLKARAGA